MPTIVSVDLFKPEPIQGSTSLGSSGATGNEDVTYRVVFNNRTATAADAEGAVAAYGTIRAGRTLTSKRTRQRPESPNEWLVTEVYTIPDPRTESPPADLDTEDGSRWAIDWSVQSSPYEAQLQRDIHNKQIINSAGDPVEFNITKNDTDFIVDFTTNVVPWADLDEADGEDGEGSANSVEITLTIGGSEVVFPAETLRFIGYDVTSSASEAGVFNKIKMRLRRRKSNWRRKVVDKGLYEIDADDLHVPILDGKGNQVTTPQYLNGSGLPQSPGELAIILPSGFDTDPSVEHKGIEFLPLVDFGTTLLWGLET